MATSLHTIGARTIAIANGIEERTKVSHVDGKVYSIVTDQLGTPTEAYNAEGDEVWSRRLDMNGNILEENYDRHAPYSEQIRIPFLFQGQYYDHEIELAYNKFRYYSPELGRYISEDPIRLAGNNPTLYAYTHDSNWWIDPMGLDLHHIIPQQIYNQFRTAFGAVEGYVQNVSKKALDTSNLIELDRPFHGNHPSYNNYVREKIANLIKEDALDLKSIRALQNEMKEHIANALQSGINLNDYFKDEHYLKNLICS